MPVLVPGTQSATATQPDLRSSSHPLFLHPVLLPRLGLPPGVGQPTQRLREELREGKSRREGSLECFPAFLFLPNGRSVRCTRRRAKREGEAEELEKGKAKTWQAQARSAVL